MLKWTLLFVLITTISFVCVYHLNIVDCNLTSKHSSEQVLFLLIKSLSYEDFLSELKDRNIKYIDNKKQETIYLTNCVVEFKKDVMQYWLWRSQEWKTFALQDEEIKKFIDKKCTPMDIIQKIGIPNLVVFEADTTTITYVFVRDEKCKRSDGYYNSSINFKFYKNQFQNFDFNIVEDLNQKDVIEFFILQ